eukprot:1150739-Pelagomonas_calceolata.AAC.7
MSMMLHKVNNRFSNPGLMSRQHLALQVFWLPHLGGVRSFFPMSPAIARLQLQEGVLRTLLLNQLVLSKR